LICFPNSGIRAIRMQTVSMTIDSAQFQPESRPKIGLNSEWKSTRMPETTQYSGCIMALPRSLMEYHKTLDTSIGIRSNITQHLVEATEWRPAGLAHASLRRTLGFPARGHTHREPRD